MIVDRDTKVETRIEIDLTGPEGNVFFLLGAAVRLSKKLNKLRGNEYFDSEAIKAEMTSSDYENAVKVFDKYFGEHVILYR